MSTRHRTTPTSEAATRRRTNLALLVLLPLAVVSGFGCFLVESGAAAPIVVAHGLIGIAVAALAPWKQLVVRRGIRKPRKGRVTSVVLLVAVVVALVSGFLHSTGFARTSPWLSAMQLHVGAALVAVIPIVLHVRRRQRLHHTDLSRRNLLQGATLLAGAGAAYAALEGVSWLWGWPGSRRRVTGSYERGSGEPDALPPTIWLFDRIPDVDASTWTVTVSSGGASRRWQVADLASARRDDTTVLLDCTGGWYSWQTWGGVPVSALLPVGATGSVEVVSRTGYRRRLPLTDDLLLATHLGGSPLGVEHGAPVRLVVPGRRGFHWVKWVVRIDHHPDIPWWVELPLPLH